MAWLLTMKEIWKYRIQIISIQKMLMHSLWINNKRLEKVRKILLLKKLKKEGLWISGRTKHINFWNVLCWIHDKIQPTRHKRNKQKWTKSLSHTLNKTMRSIGRAVNIIDVVYLCRATLCNIAKKQKSTDGWSD